MADENIEPINKSVFIENEMRRFLASRNEYYYSHVQQKTIHAVENMALKIAVKKQVQPNMDRVPLRNKILIKNGFIQDVRKQAFLEANAFAEEKYNNYLREHVARIHRQMAQIRIQLSMYPGGDQAPSVGAPIASHWASNSMRATPSATSAPSPPGKKRRETIRDGDIRCHSCDCLLPTVMDLFLHRRNKECRS